MTHVALARYGRKPITPVDPNKAHRDIIALAARYLTGSRLAECAYECAILIADEDAATLTPDSPAADTIACMASNLEDVT
jgi:hypothetical protein